MSVYAAFRPLLWLLPPETAHHVAMLGLDALATVCPPAFHRPKPAPSLRQTLFGQAFHHPVGLAAGFDKTFTHLAALQWLGFSFIEGGSVSARPWPGNPHPRLFRLPDDEALINRMGLNNPGVSAVLSRLDRWETHPQSAPLGVSVVKTPDPGLMGEAGLADFAQAVAAVQAYGTYHVLNISCPNTEEGKTFEDPALLESLLLAIEARCPQRSKPLCLKLSPDLDAGQLADLLAVAEAYHIDGLVLSNTSTRRDGLKTPTTRLAHIGRGGLSGKPLLHASEALLSAVYQRTRSWQTPPLLIGVGGIHDGPSAWRRICLGANLLQVYTAFIYHGPGLIGEINHYLAQQLAHHGLTTLEEAVGRAHTQEALSFSPATQ